MKKLCSDCFKNAGLSRTANIYGLDNNEVCNNCGSTDGKLINEKSAEDVLYRYLIDGGRFRATMPSMFKYYSSSDGFDPEQVLYFIDKESLHDIKKLSMITNFKINQNMPKTTHCGDTYFGYLFSQLFENNQKSPGFSQKLNTLIDEMLQYYEETFLDAGTLIYRVRINPEKPELDSEYDTPPQCFRKSNNRLNDIDFPVFYGAFDIETCIYESKFNSEDELYYNQLKTLQPIKLFDFSKIKDPEKITYKDPMFFEDMLYFTYFVFNTYDYISPTQSISKRIFEKRYNGIIYPSYFSRFRNTAHNNIALFGEPIENGLLKSESKGRIIIDKIQYGYSYGPVINLNELNKNFPPPSSIDN